MVGAATAVANGLVSAGGCKAKEGGTTAATTVAAVPDDDVDAFAAALQECIRSGEVCLTHCMARFVAGDASLGPCAKTVREMISVCRTSLTLALADSSHLPTAAKLCSEVCKDCAAECDKHAKMHAVCAECAAACRKTIAAAQPVAAA